jgi:hypothetical protein
MYIEKSLEVIAGAMLLMNQFVTLAPIVVNIFLFHLLMERYTLVIGIIRSCCGHF